MKRFVFILAVILASFIAVSAQTISNDVRVSAGISNVENATRFTGSVEVRKSLSERFAFNDVLSTITDGTTTLVENKALVRFSPVEHVFVSGGLGVGKLQGSDPFVNPVVQGGVNFNLGSRLNLEPFVELETPDLASDNPARTLSGNLTAKLRLTDNFGLLGQGALRSTRVNNDFFEGTAERVVKGGVYFNF